MPASRSPARSADSTLYQGSPTVGPNGSDAQCGSSPPSHAAPQPASPSAKRRRTPNAFILYRSYIFTEKKFPPELTHQNDISRYAAILWERLSEAERSVFFKMAEDMKLRAELESPTTPHKKRRSKSGKTNSSRADSLYAQSSTEGSSASDTGSPMLPMLDTFTTLSGSPLSIPAPNFDPFAPKEPNNALTSPRAPQAIRAIPPHLLNWGRDLPADSTKSGAVEHNESGPACTSSHSSLIPYEIDTNCFDSLDAEMIEMYSYFLSAMSDTQTFGYHFPV